MEIKNNIKYFKNFYRNRYFWQFKLFSNSFKLLKQ